MEEQPSIEALIPLLAHDAAHCETWSWADRLAFGIYCNKTARTLGISPKVFREQVWVLARSMPPDFDSATVESPVSGVWTSEEDLKEITDADGIRRWLVNRTYEPEEGSDDERRVELCFSSATEENIASVRRLEGRSLDELRDALMDEPLDDLKWWVNEELDLKMLLPNSSFAHFFGEPARLREVDMPKEGQVFVEVVFHGERRVVDFTQQAREMSLVIERELLKLPDAEAIAEDFIHDA